MLRTNTKNEYGILTVKSGGSAPVNSVAVSQRTSLVVTPSPCENLGDHKVPNAYSFEKTFVVEPSGSMKSATYYGYITSYSGFLGGMIGSTPSISMPDNSNTVRNKALAKLYDQIRNSEISLNTTIGEGRETLQMVMAVAHSAQLFIDKFKTFKRVASKSVLNALRNPLQTVGGLELLWAVGLSPLLNDVENLRNHVANKQEPYVDITVDSRASALEEKTKTTVSGGTTRTETRINSQRIEYGLVYQISDIHAFENWRLGLTARPTLLWELTTLSFVYDYFVNIGQYLELLEASILNNGISFVRGYETTSSKDQWWIESDKPYVFVDWVGGDGHSWHHRGSTSRKNRVVLNSFPSPIRPTVKLPSAAMPLLNCAALLSQLLPRKLK